MTDHDTGRQSANSARGGKPRCTSTWYTIWEMNKSFDLFFGGGGQKINQKIIYVTDKRYMSVTITMGIWDSSQKKIGAHFPIYMTVTPDMANDRTLTNDAYRSSRATGLGSWTYATYAKLIENARLFARPLSMARNKNKFAWRTNHLGLHGALHCTPRLP